jgi:hypothetical protein
LENRGIIQAATFIQLNTGHSKTDKPQENKAKK